MSFCICPVCHGYEYLLENEDDENSRVDCWFCESTGEWPPNYEYLEEKKKNEKLDIENDKKKTSQA